MYPAGTPGGRFARIQRAAGAAPSHGREPGSRRNDWAALGVRLRSVRPPAEPGTGTVRVDRRRGSEVLPEVEQDVDERVADLARRRQRAGVITTAPYLAVTTKTSIHRARGPPGQTLQAANQRLTRGRLSDQMQVVGLHREVNETKAAGRWRLQGPRTALQRRVRCATTAARAARESSRERGDAPRAPAAHHVACRGASPSIADQRPDVYLPRSAVMEARAAQSAILIGHCFVRRKPGCFRPDRGSRRCCPARHPPALTPPGRRPRRARGAPGPR